MCATCCRTEVVTTSIIVAASSYMVPGMSTAIAGVEHWSSEVEIVAMRIAQIDSEVPVAITPVEWAIEIGGIDKGLPLPVEQDIAQVQVAAFPIGAVYIVIAGNPHQIVEVDFVGSLVLFVCQVQLVGHLVGQEQCLVACLLVAHCFARSCIQQHHGQGYHYLFHNRIVLMVQHVLLLFTVQR